MEFTCAACGRRHVRNASMVDEFVSCACGQSFYVFYNQGMTLTVPADEMTNDSIKQLFRRFVVGTGRCRDARVDQPMSYMELLKKIDPLALMEISLERYQQETFGNQLMNAGDVETVLEIINEKKDALVKGQDDYVTVMEQKPRRSRREPSDYLSMLEDGNVVMSNGQITYLHEKPLRQWQIDIMEQDAARTGYLFGNVI